MADCNTSVNILVRDNLASLTLFLTTLTVIGLDFSGLTKYGALGHSATCPTPYGSGRIA